MSSSSEPPLLTDEGRKRLEERARRLEEETIPIVLAAIEEAEDELTLQLEYDLATRELEQLKYVLETAGSIDEIPEDPDVVQIGDWVTLQTDDGETDRHLIVAPAEAVLDSTRISAESPLALAVLGRRVGERATIDAPAGAYPVKIVETLRDRG
ncbi:MAG: GreA/GreB family elongation factor [Acidimicrobiia bacterium]